MKEYKIIETTKNKAEEVMNDMAKLDGKLSVSISGTCGKFR